MIYISHLLPDEEMKEFTDVLWGFVAVWGEISYNTC